MNSGKKTVVEINDPMLNQQRASRSARLVPPADALSALFENAPVGIFMSTIEGRMLSMNASGARMFGYSSPEDFVAEVTDTSKWLFVYPEQRVELVRRALDSMDFVRAEVSYLRRDGTIFIAHLYMRAVRDAGGRPAFMEGFVEDITERKRVEAELQQSEARYRILVDRAPLPITITRNGITVYVNRKYVELFGCESASAQVGRPFTDFLALEHREEIAERNIRRIQGLSVPDYYEVMARREDGTQFPVQIGVTTVELPDGPATLVLLTDITELKQAQAELRRHQGHLEELVTMRTADLHAALAELEHMSYSMIHDMRAPLRAMQGFARLIMDECPDMMGLPALDYLNRIIEASNRLDRFITDSLGYNKVVREKLPLRRIGLGNFLRDIVNSHPHLKPPMADVIIEGSTDVVVIGNDSLLTKCFCNLFDNATKFVAPGVHPELRVWAKASTFNRKPSTVVCVKDNGIGIPKKAQEKIFRMFQRMHDESVYPGTGVGLAIVKKAVERMSGRVGLESEPGRGSTFRVELLSAVKGD